MLLIGSVLASLSSYAAFRARLLSLTGGIAAALLGSLVFGLGGWEWAVVLLVFFLSSSALSRGFRGRNQSATENYAKGDRRDAGQVAANGAVAALFVGLHSVLGSSVWPWIGFAGALAAANADTWATELGGLSRLRPRLITDLARQVEPGTSGAVSSGGTLAALAGSAVIGAVAALLGADNPWLQFSVVALAGFLGALADSVLGATLQAMYFCPRDNRQTEKHPIHSCGSPTVLIRGWSWLNNDWVNLLCTAAGAVVSFALGLMLGAF